MIPEYNAWFSCVHSRCDFHSMVTLMFSGRDLSHCCPTVFGGASKDDTGCMGEGGRSLQLGGRAWVVVVVHFKMALRIEVY